LRLVGWCAGTVLAADGWYAGTVLAAGGADLQAAMEACVFRMPIYEWDEYVYKLYIGGPSSHSKSCSVAYWGRTVLPPNWRLA
jgi:hypothetical protein